MKIIPFQGKGREVVDDAGYAPPPTAQGPGRKDKLFSKSSSNFRPIAIFI